MEKRNLLTGLFIVLTLSVFGNTSLEIGGNANFNFQEFSEVDGKANYSMHGSGPGAVFGIGDWKQSTSDNPDDNKEDIGMDLNLNLKANIDDVVSVDADFLTLHETMNGELNGTAETPVQEFSTLQDNEALRLQNLTITANTSFGRIVATNNFNYNFNPRVLTTQLGDNWGDVMPYGEGVYLKAGFAGLDTQSFLYKTNQDTWVDGSSRSENINQIVYGADVKKDLGIANIGALVVRTQDHSQAVRNESPTYDMSNTHIALNGESSPTDMLTLRGEYITAMYGEDVDKIYNTVAPAWLNQSYSVKEDKEREDNSIMEAGATLNPIEGLEITGTYRNVGEDYYAVQGNSMERDSWLGDYSFGGGIMFCPDEGGTGYEKGLKIDTSYILPEIFNIKSTVNGSYADFEKTRSYFNDNTDDRERIIEASGDMVLGVIEGGGFIKNRLETNEDKNIDKELVHNELGVNGNLALYDSGIASLSAHGNATYYKADDKYFDGKDTNVMNEIRVRGGLNAKYQIMDNVALTGSYDLGIARDNSDIIEGTAIQNMIKTDMAYQVSSSVALNLGYKLDIYSLDITDESKENWADAAGSKDVGHLWYDGNESWQGRDSSYEGYTTHEIKASVSVAF